MQTGLVRRVLGDVIGCVTLAALVGLLVYVWPGETTQSKFKELFPPIYILLAILGYACWIKKERTMPGVSWLIGTSWSIVAGIVSLAGDILIGHLFSPSVPLLKAPLSAGIPFAVTLCLCPGFTYITIAGWTRSLVIRHRGSPP
jgi:hypothetical protein